MAVVSWWGTVSGAGVGAALGTAVFPVVGTVVGAVIGAGIGAVHDIQQTITINKPVDEVKQQLLKEYRDGRS